jgi:ABC-type antimicrobial peptide transport system permease subunit
VTVVADNAKDTIRQDRLVAMLASIFGVIAVALACLGLYGLMSYGVRQRRSEIGVRLALGAPRARVLWTVLRECLTLTALGITAGLIVVVAGARVVRTLLFEVTPLDPLTISAGIAAVAVVAALSGFLPARRASLVDPVVALRDE